MKITKVISSSHNDIYHITRREVICSDGKTRHIRKVGGRWQYLSHYKNAKSEYPVYGKMEE